MSQVRLSVEGDKDLEADLYAWLRRDPQVRPLVTRVANPAPPGAMGELAAIVITLAMPGGVLVELTKVFGAWVAARRASVQIGVPGPDGRTRSVGVEAGDADAAERLLKAATEAMADSAPAHPAELD